MNTIYSVPYSMKSRKKSNPFYFISKLNFYQIISYILILSGISIRIYHYLVNRSLWLDEALLSNSIISSDFAGLLEPLDNRQIAPIGFLFAQKISVIIFGENEFALRLFPLLCGILSLPFFYLLLKRLTDEKMVIPGLILFVFGKYLLYFSHEAKQYNLDVLFYSIVIYFFYLKDLAKDSYLKLIAKGILGGLLIWFSHITIIFLVSIGSLLFIEALVKKDLEKIKKLLVPISIGTISIGLNYFLFLRGNSNETIQITAFTSIGYFPPNLFQLKNLSWFYTIIIHLIEYPLGTTSGIFIFAFLLLGCFHIIKSKKYKILLMGFPIFVHFLLSCFRFYPFYGRFILYTTVFIIVVLIMGFDFLIHWMPRFGFWISVIVILVFMCMPIKKCFKPFYFEEIKKPIAFIEKNESENDLLYVYSIATHSFKFYQKKYTLPENVIMGNVYNFNTERYNMELEKMAQSGEERVWLLFSHIDKDQKQYFIDKTCQIGTLKSSYEAKGASAYLFEIIK